MDRDFRISRAVLFSFCRVDVFGEKATGQKNMEWVDGGSYGEEEIREGFLGRVSRLRKKLRLILRLVLLHRESGFPLYLFLKRKRMPLQSLMQLRSS